VQTGIQAWGGIYATVTVTGSAGGPYTVTFPAITSNVAPEAAPFTVVSNALTGGTNPKVTIAATASGSVDSTIRAVAGDWSQAAYGVGMDITIKVSTEATTTTAPTGTAPSRRTSRCCWSRRTTDS
jgi:hypothetical protein